MGRRLSASVDAAASPRRLQSRPFGRKARAYYSKLLLQAKEQKRIEFVPVDLLMQVRAYFDIGGTGARADAVSIWVAQFVGRKSTS